MKSISLIVGIIIFSLMKISTVYAQDFQLVVDVDHPGAEIKPTMWGLFFEDINFAADGGLYAELIKNRSFEFPDPKTGWITQGNFFSSNLTFYNRGGETANKRYASIKVSGNSEPSDLISTGFRGIGIKEGEEYRFSVWVSLPEESDIKIQATLLTEDDSALGSIIIQPNGKEWKKYESVIKAEKTDKKGKLKLSFTGEGVINFDVVSLFPVNTWNTRENGLRYDLVKLLADMKPGFLRFPGGCIVEGRDLSKRYQWKQTVGDIEDRTLNINRWNDENSRATPDYFQSYGLGFYEYFLLSEDLGAEPIPIVNCGMACQFNTGELVPLDQMDSYVKDALDLIEFANGPITSDWGKIRAEMGHPEPFNMKYIGIGNEQWGEQYFERYTLFEKALQDIYPEIEIISTSGPMAEGPFFDYAEKALKNFSPALVDEHYYNSPAWFFENVERYDKYERDQYKIFLGEFAAASHRMASPENKNTWECALSEAAYMTGLERNADVVNMVSYAPLLAHVDAWQWTPDLIWFDNLNSYGTPNYYVQKLFSTNNGTHVLSIENDGKALVGENGIYGSAVCDDQSNEVILKLVNRNETVNPVQIKLNASAKFSSDGKLIVLKSTDLNAMNSLKNPENIKPEEKTQQQKNNTLEVELEPYSLTIIKLKKQI